MSLKQTEEALLKRNNDYIIILQGNKLVLMAQSGAALEKAIEYFTKAAELGSAEAMCELGELYKQGAYGLERNFKKAVELYQKAAALKSYCAYRKLSSCYQYGHGVEKDLEKALEYLVTAYSELSIKTA